MSELWQELRRLTVAHQTPGVCAYCDELFDKIKDVAERLCAEAQDTEIQLLTEAGYLRCD